MSTLIPLFILTVPGVRIDRSNPHPIYSGLSAKRPTWRSAQGEVYHCRDFGDASRNVAIKKYLVIERDKDGKPFAIPNKLIQNECNAMTKCAPHPNILRLHSIYIYNCYAFLVTPYYDGGTLKQYCFENCVTLAQIVFILNRLVSSLAEIHKHGYIHRDIKSENVFLGVDNAIVIGGFGFSSPKPFVNSASEVAGDILFWAPEICKGEFIKQNVDIWALGIVVLEILNYGKAPFEDDRLEEEELKRKIIDEGRPHYPQNMDGLLAGFVDRCLDPDHIQRASARELLKHSFLSPDVEAPLFPPRPRQQPSSLAEALNANTSQTPSPSPEALTSYTPQTPSSQPEALTTSTLQITPLQPGASAYTNPPMSYSQLEAFNANTLQISSQQTEALTENTFRMLSMQPGASTDNNPQTPSPQPEELNANTPQMPSQQTEALISSIPQTPSPQPKALAANTLQIPPLQPGASTYNIPQTSSQETEASTNTLQMRSLQRGASTDNKPQTPSSQPKELNANILQTPSQQTEVFISSTSQTPSPQPESLTTNILQMPEGSAANTPQTPNLDLWLNEYAANVIF
ncbi:kinase-like domain-containing protein [Jimgerdemannia flammicorona]|uniref:non-specific serine/threonine protein kinase n=1 Tax=Jimgerdemannia flammicorona TaxID=994334 RepID=A0A433DCG1_9FUNG|nr:kinase-like domain-containing protein [Jimgerdemannia flammicorona]